MWRAHFYEKSWIGRYLYIPIVGFCCVAYILVVGYRHAAGGQPSALLAIVLPGFVLFLVAKLSVLRKRIWFSFGTDHMSSVATACYLIGYGLMTIGFVLGFQAG